jgi:hypothetical protein
MRYNKQAVMIKALVDKTREQHESIKYMFYNSDDSEGAKLLMKNTERKGFFRARYLNPDALKYRNSLFKKVPDA